MNGFTLSNNCSINLNYLIYIHNIYSNKYTIRSNFQFFPLDDNGFLTPKEFKNTFIKVWKSVVNSPQNYSLAMWDMEHFENRENHYKVLFEDNKNGMCRFQETMDSFLSWWMQESCGGQTILNALTDEKVPIIYNRILEKFKEIEKTIPSGNFYIQIVYDNIPHDCADSAPSFILEPLKNFYYRHDVDFIVERLFKHLNSSFN